MEMGKFLRECDGDGENLMGMGTVLFTMSLSVRSTIAST